MGYDGGDRRMSTNSQRLNAQVKVRQHHLRSAHLEHHEGQFVGTYIPTGRALEVLHRIARAMRNSGAGRSWSLTGPYGAGKSSFALFVHALLGPDDNEARNGAEDALRAAEPELLALMKDGRQAFGATSRGFIRAAATAQREPANETVLRAFNTGAYGYWRTRMPRDVKSALATADQDRTPRALGMALEALCAHAPMLIEIDEFGKNLEYFAGNATEDDLFVLQELAERCAGDHGLPALLITLQHMAFDDYVRSASALQRREWGKVQGRFEDISFVESAEQSLRLVAGAFEPHSRDATFQSSLNAWAAAEAKTCERLGLTRFLPGGAATLASCYPLHPMTLLTLPDMCARFGQYGRTLFSFLTSHEPHSVAEFLDAETVRAPLPTVGLDRLYDFFVGTAATTGSRHAARLTEIDTAIRDSTGITDEQRNVLKVVGVLNALSQGGPLRASVPIIRYALSAAVPLTDRTVRKVITELEHRGLLTYRGFADEYRVWQGSDLDLAALVEQAREELAHVSSAELLAGQHQMPPAIAGKHSQRVGMLRYFETVFADADTNTVPRLGVKDAADGLLVYFLGPPEEASKLSIQPGSKPVVIATTAGHAMIVEAVSEYAAILRTLERSDVQSDRVARRELQDRAADARRRLFDRVSEHLHPASAGVQFRLAGTEEPLPVKRGLSSLLSQVCDDVYNASPEISNEMLGRRDLTSQAAKARRKLLTAMVEHYYEEWLGMEGFGPEKAMYAALLRHPRIHRDAGEGTFGYHQPSRGSMNVTWGTMTQLVGRATRDPIALDQLYAKLMEPPIGLKEGPIPVLLTALLLHRVDDVAIYQEGTYQPSVTAELLERLIKSPDRFAVKHFKLTKDRIQFLEAIARAVGNVIGRAPTASRGRGVAGRNGALLDVTAPLLSMVRNLPAYTQRTNTLSERARAVRDTIQTAREPDELIFNDLPTALAMEGLGAKAGSNQAEFAAFSRQLEAALMELDGGYRALLNKCQHFLAIELRLAQDKMPDLRLALRDRAQGLADTLLEPRLRSFVLLVANEDLDDNAWLEAVANNIAGRPAAGWRDEDVERFTVELRAIASAFRRYQALHYEVLAGNGKAGFAAHRVTVTSPGGSEYSDVVWVDEQTKPQLQDVADQALYAAEKLFGPRAGEALMALLAGTVVRARHDGSARVARATPQRKAQNG
jgi:hypothetical protein